MFEHVFKEHTLCFLIHILNFKIAQTQQLSHFIIHGQEHMFEHMFLTMNYFTS